MNRRSEGEFPKPKRTAGFAFAAALATVAITAGCALAASSGANAAPAAAKAQTPAAPASRSGRAASTGRTTVELKEGAGLVGSIRTGAPVKLAPGQAVSLAGGLSSVGFARVIEDSRCPRGTTCVWAGRARVEIETRKSPSGPSKMVEVEVGSPEKGAVDLAGMRVVAKALEPYPEAKVPVAAGDYRLQLELVEATATAKR